MRAIFLAALLAPSTAAAVCLNPFGCAPETQVECIKGAGAAKTEAAAKAMIIECRKLPKVTRQECKVAEQRWAEYMVSRAGVEWDWPEWSTKSECSIQFPGMFSPALWISPAYCEGNAARLAQAPNEIDAVSLKSVKLERVRRSEPALDGLDDRHAVELLRRVHYQDMSSAELAAAVYLDAPPAPLAVAAECKRIARGSSMN